MHLSFYNYNTIKLDNERKVITLPNEQLKKIFNYNSLKACLDKCMQNVSWKDSSQKFYLNCLSRLDTLHYKIQNGESIHVKFHEFELNERGKVRHIRSVPFEERIVQKILCSKILIPVLTKTFIYDNGASLKNKGITFTKARLKKHLWDYFLQNNRNNEGYILLMDYTKFFDSIDHDILITMLREKIPDDTIIQFIEQFIRCFDPKYPVSGGKSLGLGSEVSQILSLFFPNKVDHFIKEKLRMKYYGRYMDDSYIIMKNKDELKEILKIITTECAKYKITLNPKKVQIRKLNHDFIYLKDKIRLTETGKIIISPLRKNIRREIQHGNKILLIPE